MQQPKTRVPRTSPSAFLILHSDKKRATTPKGCLQECLQECLLPAQPRSANFPPCLVRPKNQFSLTRAALSTGERERSKSISSVCALPSQDFDRGANMTFSRTDPFTAYPARRASGTGNWDQPKDLQRPNRIHCASSLQALRRFSTSDRTCAESSALNCVPPKTVATNPKTMPSQKCPAEPRTAPSIPKPKIIANPMTQK